MSNPGFYQETHWRHLVVFADDGVARNVSGLVWLAKLFAKDGSVAFQWKSSGAGASDGIINASDAARGVVALEATQVQHNAVLAGKPYTWTLYENGTPTDLQYMANGFAFVGMPGATETKFVTLHIVPIEGTAVARYVGTVLIGGVQLTFVSGLLSEGGVFYSGTIIVGGVQLTFVNGVLIDDAGPYTGVMIISGVQLTFVEGRLVNAQ